MLIDTRDPPPRDEGLPTWEPNWAMWLRVALAIGLGWGATESTGALAMLLIFAAFAAAFSAVGAVFDYWGGLTEWRQ
ncbi:MAG: hypothetical protein AABM31_10455 [Actinomycetota bacterium]